MVESLKSAYKRRYGQSESAVVEFNEKTGDFQVYTVREVVDEVFDSRLEISLKDALAISSAYELGDKIRFEESVDEFGRVAAQSAKQTIMEKMRKQMREITYNDYKQHEGEIMQGTVERFDQRFIYVNLGTVSYTHLCHVPIIAKIYPLLVIEKEFSKNVRVFIRKVSGNKPCTVK